MLKWEYQNNFLYTLNDGVIGFFVGEKASPYFFYDDGQCYKMFTDYFMCEPSQQPISIIDSGLEI